jgi:mannosyltransferase
MMMLSKWISNFRLPAWRTIKIFYQKFFDKTDLIKYMQDNSFIKNAWIPLFLVFVNLILKSWHLQLQSIAGDEAFSIYISQFDVRSIIHYLSQGNNPPLFEIILHYWIKVFGIGSISVRLLPCIFSSLTVWFIYKTGTIFFSFKAGILSALLFTLSNYQMYYAHETRVYSLFLLLSCISFYAFMHLIKNDSVKYRIIHAVSLVLMLYAHYLSFFIIAVQLFSCLILKEVRIKMLKTYLVQMGIALMCFLPLVPFFIKRLHDSTAYGTWLHPVTSLGQLHDVLKFLTNDIVTNYIIIIVIFWFVIQKFFHQLTTHAVLTLFLSLISIFFLFYGISVIAPMPRYWEFSSKPMAMISYLSFMAFLLFISQHSKTVSTYTKILISWFFFPLLTMFVSSFWIPMFLDRYLIFITGAFFLLLGKGISYLNERGSLEISILTLALFAISFETNVDKKRHVSEVVQKVKELKTDKTVVYMCPNGFDLEFSYYYNRNYFADIDDPDTKEKLCLHLATENIYPICSFKQLDTTIIKNSSSVIYIDAAADFGCPGNQIKSFLDSTLSLCQQYSVPDIYRIYEYIKPIKQH